MAKSPNDIVSELQNKRNSDTVFIIGGGQSLSRILPDPSIIYTKDIICANNAYKLFPNALCLHWIDPVWWSWHTSPKHDVLNTFKGIITSGSPNRSKNRDIVTYFNTINKNDGIATDKSFLYGKNTGHQCINIAVHISYKNICLIGFDSDSSASITHWHSDHERLVHKEIYDKNMIPGFNSIVPYQEQLSFKVWNLNHESRIRCFDFAELSDFL